MIEGGLVSCMALGSTAHFILGSLRHDNTPSSTEDGYSPHRFGYISLYENLLPDYEKLLPNGYDNLRTLVTHR